MFDVKAVEAEAQAEINEERAERAKAKIKSKLSEISRLEQALANARVEYKVLLEDIGTQV